MENEKNLSTIYGSDSSQCIHPDAKGWELPVNYLRENIRSAKDPICRFCGNRCKKPIDGPDPKFLRHKVGDNFIYCPVKDRAIRITNQDGGAVTSPKMEICPLEAGGCGLYIPHDNLDT